ncbi:MAG: type II toxin-antitoxin system HipA family toxin [Verrucomicrobiales bacterium]|nr:type II toxin-antitoxin system HipA family toxin [Verrucomicrobiales bacterium]
MATIAEIRLWGKPIGAVSLDDGETTARFAYDPSFLRSKIEVAPLMMPLSERIYTFPSLNPESFHGLPGLLADALPDKFGNALINAWLIRQGRRPESFNAIERLCYTGRRGMGALEFLPSTGPSAKASKAVAVDQLVALASEILSQREGIRLSFDEDHRETALRDILRVGTSAGGARAKAVIAWNPRTNEVRSGQVELEAGFEAWLLKFDGVTGNKDKELLDPEGYGVIEYAYHLMARDAGITMSACRLFEENGRRHFMTRRFDRPDTGGKLHLQSLCAMAHYDFNLAGAYGYEQAYEVMRRLDLPMADLEEQFRRMLFNLVARNQDDHTKNIAFLMDKAGRWRLSPAFDVTYSYNPDGAWTSRHQMSVNGKRDQFELADLVACARNAGLKRGRAATLLEQVITAARRWKDHAEDAGVPERDAEKIASVFRLDWK